MLSTARIAMLTLAAVLALSASSPAMAEPPAKPTSDKPGNKPAAKPTDDDKKATVSDAEAQRFYVFFDKLAAIVVANQDDCKKMAAGLNRHIDQNQAVIKAFGDAKDQHKQLPPAVKDKIAKKYANEVAPAMQKKCAADKPVMEALLRIHPPQAPDADREHERERERD